MARSVLGIRRAKSFDITDNFICDWTSAEFMLRAGADIATSRPHNGVCTNVFEALERHSKANSAPCACAGSVHFAATAFDDTQVAG